MNVCAEVCVYAHTDTYSVMRKSVEKRVFGGQGTVFLLILLKNIITDNIYNYQNIVIINVSLTFIGFIIVFNSAMTTCP